MGILRSDVVSHSQLEGSGSVEFDGVGDTLTFAAHSAFAPATADVTFECFINLSTFTPTSDGSYIFDMGANGYRFQIYNSQLYFGVSGSDYVGPISNAISINTWHHLAGVRDGNALKLYVDGVHLGTKITTASVTTTSLVIGNHGGESQAGNYEPVGFISNFRYVRGVVYKGPFTPPKFELKNIPGTIVLGCQSTTSATDFAVTPSTVTANGDAAASAFHPNLKKDITDTGVVFDGVTTFDSQAYMVPPSGKTTERNRGRGVISGGRNRSTMEFINIQSQGNSQEFGDSVTGDGVEGFALGSSTRGLFSGGYPSIGNVIEFITFATQSNGTDFGDMTTGRRSGAGVGNQTRGLFAGGLNPSASDVIEFVTIATLSNSSDFGNLSLARDQLAGFSDSTRGVIAGGSTPTVQNRIDFVTIASTGVDASDFGDLTLARLGCPGLSDKTRGLIAGGSTPGEKHNLIDFVTIQSAGNATDFGDLTTLRSYAGGMSNSTRGVFAGGYTPTQLNSIDFVNIQTTGDASDYGDLSLGANFVLQATSDSHGGLAE